MDSSGRIYPGSVVQGLMDRMAAPEGESGRRVAAAAARKVKQLVALPADIAKALEGVNRAARRRWYAIYRRELKLARRQGRAPVYPPTP